VGGAGGKRRRRRRHRTKPKKDISTGTIVDIATNAATSTAAVLRFSELDPLALVLCASTGPPAWVSVDPMLEEITASLVVS
jgi:hypothetical protein